MPRVSFGYRLGDHNVLKGGYGVYYDTLNARDWTPDLEGFDVSTTNLSATTSARPWRWAIRGTASCRWPIRSRCARRQSVRVALGNTLGVDTMVGRGFSGDNHNRVHSRVQRWRVALQRELVSRTALEIAYAGSYADRQGITIRQDYLPEQYWSSANVRDNAANAYLTANVTNPFASRTSPRSR